MNEQRVWRLIRDYPVTAGTLAVMAIFLLSLAIVGTGSAPDAGASDDRIAAVTATAMATTEASATQQPGSPAATESATSAPTQEATASASAGSVQDELIAQGKVVYETAGGVGCIFCHGATGRGDGAANQGAADIRGLDKARVQGALSGGVPLMGFIKLTPAELNAVAAYVKSLAGQ